MATPLSPKSRGAGGVVSQKTLSPGVRHIIRQFIDEDSYETLHTSLAGQWDMNQCMMAALKLMGQYGVALSAEDTERLRSLDEASMIDALLAKMPAQSKDVFQSFFLQLQHVVSTATRMRQALEKGVPEEVEAALTDAEGAGVAPFVLKMAVVQAGAEVQSLKRQHANWVREVDTRMQTLLRGREDAMTAKRELDAAQEKLRQHMGDHSDKAKKMLLGMAGGQGKALMTGSYMAWAEYVRKMRQENAIRSEYEERLEAATKRLADYKAQQLDNVRNVLNRKAAAGDGALVAMCFAVFVSDVEERKKDAEQLGAVREIEEKLGKFAAEQSENAKKVMTRMSAGSDAALVNLNFQAWVTFIADYKKNKDMEDQVKAAEQKFNEFKKGKSDKAKGVLDRMAGASETGLKSEVFQGWLQIIKDEKEAQEMERMINSGEGRFRVFAERNGKNAREVSRKAAEIVEQCDMMRCFMPWKMHVRVERQLKKHAIQVEGKRGQLQNVQLLFRQFTTQLETGLKMETPREVLDKARKPRMSKDSNTVSLPDIHARPGGAATGGSGSRRGSHRSAAE